jgi:hypothetical protein
VQRADNRIGGTRAMVLCVLSMSFGGADIPINFVYRTQVLPIKFENGHVGCFTEARRTPVGEVLMILRTSAVALDAGR